MLASDNTSFLMGQLWGEKELWTGLLRVALSSGVPRGNPRALCASAPSPLELWQFCCSAQRMGIKWEKGVHSTSSLMLEAYAGIGLGPMAKGWA